MTVEPVPLSVIALDLPAPPAGWAFELERRGIPIVLDDIGRRCISRPDAAMLLGEHRENEARMVRHREELERLAIAADEEFRSQLWGGLSADRLPIDVSPAAAMFAADRELTPRRESVLQHALAHRDGAVYHPVNEVAP